MVTFLLVMADHELDPMGKSLLAVPHSMTELKALAVKTVITTADILLSTSPKIQAPIFAITTCLNIWWYWIEVRSDIP